jgi:NAD(P)H dehydrogenase (quinone)
LTYRPRINTISPVKILIILAHPHKDSFNHAIADVTVRACKENGHEVILHDLYVENFPAILLYSEIPKNADVPAVVKKYCEELTCADGIIIIHPDWWGQPPAILKGYIDRVFRPGVAYEFHEGDSGEGIPIGLLPAKAALVFNTSNTPPQREIETFGDPLQALWKNCVFALCGVDNFYRRTFGVMVTSSAEQRREWLGEVDATVKRFFPPV